MNNFCRTWAEKTVHERENVEITNLEQFSVIMYKLQLKLFQLFHVPVVGTVLRSMANSLMRLNIYLATEYQQMIVEGEEMRDKVETNKYFAVITSVFIISVLTTGSLLKIVQNSIPKVRCEIILFFAASILSVLIFSMS